MERSRIILGGAEISKRYIGNRLVWEAERLIYKGKTNIYKDTYTSVYFYIDRTNKSTASRFIINGKQIQFNSITINGNMVTVYFRNYYDMGQYVNNTVDIELYE